jgi:predicted Zn-ribbon and HTH transcriptional regulator
MPNSNSTHRQISARRAANREQKTLDVTYTRCIQCGCNFIRDEGINGTCGDFNCLSNQSMSICRDSGESASTFGYRW